MRAIELRWILLALTALALIIVPFALYGDWFAERVSGLLGSGAARPVVAVSVVGLLASDVVAPVPSSLVATAAGMLLGLGPGAAASWIGMQTGALVGYAVGNTAGAAAARRFVGRPSLETAASLHSRWAAASLVASRAVPVLAEASVVAAGAASMPIGKFAWATGLSNAAIAVVYAAVGAHALEANAFALAFVASVVVPGALYWAGRALVRRRSRAPDGAGGPVE